MESRRHGQGIEENMEGLGREARSRALGGVRKGVSIHTKEQTSAS